MKTGLTPAESMVVNGGERSNAAFRTQSAARQTSLAPHDSKARLISVTTCRRFMAKPCTPHPHCAARAVIQAINCQCRGSRGTPLVLSLGGVRGIFSFREREYPPLPRPPHGVGDNRVRPAGAKKEAPLRVLPFYSTVTDFARLRGLSISHPRWSAI